MHRVTSKSTEEETQSRRQLKGKGYSGNKGGKNKSNSTDLFFNTHPLPTTLATWSPKGSKMNETHSLPSRTLTGGGGGRGQVTLIMGVR